MLSRGRRTRRPWKTWRWVAISSALTLVLAACGGGGGESGDDAGAEGLSPAPSDEQVDLTIWFTQEEGTPSFDAFEAEHPNVNVTVDIIPSDDTFPQLLRLQDAGEKLPDIVRFDGFLKAGMTEAGILRPIDDIVAAWEDEDPESMGKLVPSTFASTEWDGQTMGMAYDCSMDQFYYRADWLQEAGYDVPWQPESHDELLQALRDLKKTRPDTIPWAMFGARGEGVNYLFAHMAAAGVQFDGATPQLDSEPGHYIIDWYQTVVREGLTSPDVLALGGDEAVGQFLGGQAATIIESIGLANDLEPVENMEYPDQWQIATLPYSRDGSTEDGVQVANPWTFGVTTDTEYPYEAGLLLRYLMQDEIVAEVSKDNIVRQDSVFESDLIPELYPALRPEHVEILAEAEGFPTDVNFFEVEDVLEQFMQDVLQNPDTPPEELASKWQAELDALA
jgi:multiple sugar transport system substrate-binding protein